MIALCSKCHTARRVRGTDPKRILAKCPTDGQRCDFHLHAEGAGDLLASGLAAIGITKARTANLLRAWGLLNGGEDCGCGKRQEALNKVLPLK